MRPLLAFLGVGLLSICLAMSPSVAQDGMDSTLLPSEFQGPEYRLDSNKLRFCIYSRSPIREFEIAAAELIGDSLLLTTEIVMVEPPIDISGLDIIPISIDDLFIRLSNDCDGFMGVELVADVYPAWMAVSAPYFSAPYVMVTHEGAAATLPQLPSRAGIATQSLTSGDTAFGAFNNALPADAKLRRRPYPTTVLQLERLQDGTETAAVIWRPWLDRSDINHAGLSLMDSAPLVLPSRSLGIALRARDTFLRQSLDQTISGLSDLGAFDTLYGEVAGAP